MKTAWFWIVVLCASTLEAAYAGTAGIPALAQPMERLANTVHGPLGYSAASLGIAWTGACWAAHTEHGRSAFISMGTGCGLIFGAPLITGSLGGSSALPLVALVPTALQGVSTVVGDWLGQWALAGWMVCAIQGVRHVRG